MNPAKLFPFKGMRRGAGARDEASCTDDTEVGHTDRVPVPGLSNRPPMKKLPPLPPPRQASASSAPEQTAEQQSLSPRMTTHFELLYDQLWKRRPRLQRRCELLRLKYPREDFVVKVTLPDVMDFKFYRFSPRMLVSEALKKIKERKRITSVPQELLGLYLPPKDDSNDGVWMDPSYPLWMYNLSYQQVVEIKARPGRDDPIHRQVFLRVLIHDADDQIITRTFGFDTRHSVGHVLQEINQRVPPAYGSSKASRVHYGLYLYNNTHGMWLQENKPLSFYNITHMDIVGFKEKSLYHFRLEGLPEADTNTLLLPCDIPIKDAITQMAVSVGLERAAAAEYGIWVEGRGTFAAVDSTIAAYSLEPGDVLVLKGNTDAGGQRPDEARGYRLKLIKADPPAEENAKEESRDSGGFREFASFKLFPRLEGEVVVKIIANAYWAPPYVKDVDTAGYTGDLYITNYRLALFVPTFAFSTSEEDTCLAVTLPLGAISRVEVGKQNNARKYYVEVHSKDFRILRFLFGRTEKHQRDSLHRSLVESGLLFPRTPERLFAFFYKPSHLIDDYSAAPQISESGGELESRAKAEADRELGGLSDRAGDREDDEWKSEGWRIFSARAEFQRQGVPNSKWRLTDVNKDYAYCESYPSLLAVPAGISDEELKEVFAFRSKGRMPVVCYRHTNNVAIARCSQPLAGLTRTRSMADEKLFRLMLDNSLGGSSASSGQKQLYIMDARPRANAYANAAKGGGIENLQGYPQCKFEYLGIPNIHVIRESQSKLNSVCVMAAGECEGGILSALDASKWMDYIKLILEGALKVARLVEEERCPVTLHCSDGWDRTAQLSSLAQIFLDPYFRTTVGFQVLIEKEWLSFGHKFSTRCGHGDKNHQDSQRAPIFLQFIDCVWQLTQQNPCLFEFNEKFLIAILEHLYSCRFGTFLCDTEKQRTDQRLKEKTVSLWSYTNCGQNRREYLNPFYVPDMSVLFPDVSFFSLSLWKGYHMRHLVPPTLPRLTPQLRILQLQNVIEGMKEQMVRLENYREKHKQRKNGDLVASRDSSRSKGGAEDDRPLSGADQGEADDGQLLEETQAANIMRGSANVMGAF